MRHGFAFRKLSRNPVKRERLLRNLASHLFEHERIQTTLARAKELKRHAEKLITLARRGTEHAQIKLQDCLNKGSIVEKLMGPLAKRYSHRPGGYTRLWRAGPRARDKAQQAIIELVGNPFDMRAAFSRMASERQDRLPLLKYPEPHKGLNRPLLK